MESAKEYDATADAPPHLNFQALIAGGGRRGGADNSIS